MKYDEDITLYKREDNGRMRMWRIVRQGNKHKTFSGLVDGAITETSWTESRGKNYGKINATTDNEQASFDVSVKVRHRREKGFSETGDAPTIIEGREWIKPTLAQKWDDKKHKIIYPAFTSPKLDGIRCIITKDGMFSRNGKEIVALPHIRQELDKWFKQYPDLIIDGELYNHKLRSDFDRLCSIVKKKKPTPADLEEARHVMQFWVFDLKEDAPFEERYKKYGRLFFNKSDIVVPVKQFSVQSEDDVERSCKDFIKSGFEGGMIRNVDMPYVEKRTWNLLKYKVFVDEECTILDIEEGVGNRSGMMGRLILQRSNGIQFESSAMGSHDFFRDLWINKHDYIGKIATVKYQNLTPKGKPRFPVVTSIRDYE